MKKKSKWMLVLFLIASNSAFSQMPDNANPGYIPDSADYIRSIPQMVPNPASLLLTLPAEVDNSNQIFFPKENNTLVNKMYDQKQSGSCSFASTIWYAFTYEINRLRGTAANTPQRRFVPNGGYNYYNKGLYQQGTSFSDARKYLQQHGAISESDWGNADAEDYLRWLSGYDKHLNSLNNRIDSVSEIKIELDGTGLDLLKHYFFDHNEGSDVGGIVNMDLMACGNSVELDSSSAHTGEMVITSLGPCSHALTIVGYCDDIKYDFNKDGQFTNHLDLNGDGLFDIRDWEIGGVRLANSYGTGLGTDGFEWLPYRFLSNKYTYALHATADYDPEIVLKVKASHFDRNDLVIGSGYAPNANYSEPTYTKPYHFLLKRGGDNMPLRGNLFPDTTLDYSPMELILDFSYNHPNADIGKVFLFTFNINTTTAEGVIHDFSLIDYRWNEVFELEYELHNFAIPSNDAYFGIEYDLIPHETPIADDLTFEANMVSRFYPTVENNSTLTINNGVRIDMYNSEITIERGSTLLAGNNVTFLGKRGNSRIIIKGEATFGDNLLVKAEDGATIELVFDNTAIISTISNAYFENTNITIACPNVSIEGSTFSAKPDNKFIIARGGKLQSDNNLFTSFNHNFWQGIEVQGNRNVVQTTSAQGMLVINGGNIENAEYGIRTWKPINGTNTPDHDYSGGLVIANGVNFTNNRVAVEFLPYNYINNSYFKKCTFITNAALPNGDSPDYFVRLNSVSNIRFQGCSFTNTLIGQPVTKWGSGIYAYDADLFIDQVCTDFSMPCNEYSESTFTGLYRGIYALGTTNQRVTLIHNSKFNNTLRGMYLGHTDFASIKLNNFEVIATVPGLNPGGYGLYMDASTAFAIEENDFHSAGSTREGKGLIINEAGPDNNEVYNNKFRNLEYGSIAQGYNKQSSGSVDGLCYKCNDFINNGTDIRISPRNTWKITAMDGIAYHQGANIPANNLAPAGNTFTTTSNLKDISNACNWIIYYRHQYGPASLLPNPADLTTNYQVFGTTYTKTISCPSRIDTGTGKEETRLAMEDAETLAGEVQASLDAIVDGGSTPELQAEVANSTPDEGLVLRNQLLTGSPYLSDTVIKTSITKEEVLNNAMIRDVLVANPQSAKSAQMVEMLDERMVPMTDEMKNEVLSGQTITSGKENLEATLSSYKHEVWVNFASLCNLYASDTLHTWQSDTMGVLLAGANTPGTCYQLAFWQLFKGNPSAAQQVMSNIPSEFTLDAVELAQHSRYATLLNELIAFESNPEMLLEPGTPIYEALMQLSTSSEDKPAALSRNLLLSAGLTEYEEPIKLDDGLKSMPIYKPEAKVAQSQKLKVYPNPANTFVTVSWNTPGQGNTTLMIHDANGRKVHTRPLQGLNNETIVDISGFVHGTYTVSLSQGGKTIATETLVIAR